MIAAGYLSSIVIGISLGLIGGGGSILTVPVLVYLFHMDAADAIVYSLFIVGIASTTGSLGYFKNGLVNTKMVIAFGLPSLIAVFATRYFVVPHIPTIIFKTVNFTFTKSMLTMILFAVTMLAASYSMLKKNNISANNSCQQTLNYQSLVTKALLIGMLTGMIGAGGGFVIIPALLFAGNLQMKEAIGTSLVIIALNSLIGFITSVGSTGINWQFLLTVSAFAVSGILAGIFISKSIDGAKLKPAFGWFVLVMGFYIIIKETILK
ncbi:MAG TPA: sulfite exporter TauE/SafE family protein [Bacteroidia bacterium]|nr:sulfite exporter TauE/SafE family protein [Bacteroidia bacterium]HNU33529.1 sulfite exporter TauE/SafE family protein [Bacteroidia bacterium]